MKTQDPEGTGTVTCLEGWRGSYRLGLPSGGQFRATGAGAVKEAGRAQGTGRLLTEVGDASPYLGRPRMPQCPHLGAGDYVASQLWEASALG